ncbi:hypothetical protein B0H14DRAFT_3428515 [Mycena olivaceomarginata]|nr:hypothetical protein B0H14DRAFT_3428515 [Mycena olivaceomarginata]
MPGITAASSPGPATQAIISVEIGRTARRTTISYLGYKSHSNTRRAFSARAAPTINGARPPHQIPTTRPRSAHVSHSPACPARRPPPAPHPPTLPHQKRAPRRVGALPNPPIVGTHMHHRALRYHQRPLGHARAARFPARPLPPRSKIPPLAPPVPAAARPCVRCALARPLAPRSATRPKHRFSVHARL